MIQSLNVAIPAAASAIHAVADEVSHLLEQNLWPADDCVKVVLALREALANSVRHGCQDDPSKQVRCSVTHDDQSGEILIVVRDEGPGFDITAVADPTEPSHLLRTNGRGVFLMTRVMDEVSFVDGGREVQMRKRRSQHNLFRVSRLPALA